MKKSEERLIKSSSNTENMLVSNKKLDLKLEEDYSSGKNHFKSKNNLYIENIFVIIYIHKNKLMKPFIIFYGLNIHLKNNIMMNN